MRRFLPSRALAVVVAMLAMTMSTARVQAQDRVLGKQDILLYGFGLRVEPERQVVPKDIATIVSTFLQAPNTPPGDTPPFAPDAVVRATLRGPAVGNGLELTAKPNTPFNIPPLGVAGVHTLENIRLESGGEVLMRGVPESTTIEVIEKLLVTQVTARALTAQEIREKGIVFDKSNFQAYNFTAAFAIQDHPVVVNFPVVLPTLQGASDVSVSQVGLGGIRPPSLPELKTIIPDTLRLQTQIPNLKVVGFTLKVPPILGKDFYVPPIPGVVVIPGDIGFLNQFFSVMLMVGNVAPEGSNLTVDQLTGEILLPAGNDTVVGSSDDPLRMAQTAQGESPRIRFVVQPGPDGKVGTADDITTLGPGESGNAEYLVEGRREGTHIIEFNIAGTLHGLPVGPVAVTGRAAGSVLVRNPAFTLTFTHPDTVAAGEAYSLDVTVTNTSEAIANFVSVNLFSKNVSGATVVGDPSRQIESIPPGDSATVSFDMVSRVTGRVTAATLDADDNVAGRFSLKTAVGELGVPVSPDSLILPAPARSLPADLRNAALGLLGKAWAVATAPAAALPLDVSRFSKQIVYDRAIDVAEAGYRVSLHEPLTLSALQLEMDFIGSDFGRLAQKYPNADDLAFAERDFRGFDELRRRSVRGDTWAAAVGRVIAEELAGAGAAAFHRTFADAVSYRPPSVSVLVRAPAGPMPFTIRVVDAQGRRVGSTDEKGKVLKEIPFSDSISVLDATGLVTGQLVILAAPLTGEYHVQFDAVVGAPIDAPFDVSIVVPDATGVMRQVVYHATGGAVPASAFAPADPYRVLLDLPVAGAPSTGPLAVASDERIPPTVPRLLSAVQQANADIISCSVSLVTEDGLVDTFHVGYQAGRVIALLFSEEVTPESVQDRLAASDITRYLIDGNKVVGVALQPGGRIAFLALRDPIGPFVPRVITVDGVGGLRGGVMSSQSVAIESTVTDPGALVTGQVLNADGTPIPFANVRLLIDPCDPSRRGLVGVSSKTTDADGRFSWDFVVQGQVARIAAVDPATDDSRAVDFTSQRNGQRLNVNLVFLGRGTLKGRTLDEQGQPIPHANVRITSLTDQSQYGATSDDLGAFTIARIPVGNLFIEAVSVVADEDGHLLRNAKGTLAELIPVAGGTTVRDITLFDFITPPVDVKFGALAGHVLRGDGATPVNDVPVVAYYKTRSQANVTCPGDVGECAVGLARTDSTGAFLMDRLSAGEFKLVFFDQASFQQGEARVVVPENGTTNVNLLLSQGIGTVHGLVLDPAGQPVAGARVGGGLSLTTTDGTGQFTLIDVPVGRREIVAVSDALGTKGTAIVNLVQAGQTVEATVVLEPVAGVAGTVFQADGVTPVPFNAVYLFYEANGGIQVVGQTTTDATGRYAFSSLALRNDYRVSSFRPDFSDGNVKKIVLKFSNQVVRGDIVFRGGGGRITGRVLDSDGATPLKAAVSVSGEQLSVAGGMVGVGFSNVANFEVTETDFTTGQFAFSNIWVGPVTVTAIGQFSPDPIATEVTMPSPGATVNVELRLQATSRIEGTVFQPDGVTPVGPDVIVRYKSSEKKTVCASGSLVIIGSITIPPLSCADVPQGIQEEIVVTDANGRFLVPLVNAGQFTLTAEDVATGKTARVAGDVKPGQAGEFSMRLLGLGTLTINVRGSDSTTPIPGAAVEVRQIAFPKKTVLATADSAGTLQLDGGDAFSEGELVVMARDLRNGFEGRAAGKVIVDGEHVTINVFLFNQAGRVFGTVFKPDGLTPVPNADVVISNARGALAFGVTDGDGNYSQDTIPLGEFRVDVFEAATARLGFGLGRIDLDKQAVPVNVVELGRGLVTGTVLEVGTLAPVKNAEVILLQSSPGGRSLPSLQTTSGVDGTFSFPGATVGAFQVRASKTARLTGDPSGSATASATLGHDGERVDVPVLLTLNRPAYGRVEATVVNADGSPAPNVAVSLCASCSQYVGAITGPDGTVAFDHVVVGRFSVYAESQVNLSATSAHGELTFEGDLARVLLTLTGVSEVTGTVEFANGAPAANVEVTLSGSPSSGCQEASVRTCTVFANASGAFSFINVPARTFTVSARDPIGGLRGSVSGALTPGDHEVVRVVLEPTGRLSGRTVFLNGGPAAGVTVEAILPVDGPAPDEHFFEVTDQNGQFDYPALPIGTYAVSFEDPLGSGIARRTVVLTGDTDLGNIVLDDALPGVASVIPAAASVGVPRNTAVQIVFSEPVDAATVTQANISLVGPVSTVLGTLQLSAGDTTVTFTPLAPLVDQTLYSLTVQRIKDRIGKLMTPAFSSSFTTVDVTPPVAVDLSPASGSSGAPIASVVRVKYSEPVDVSRFASAPIVVRKAGTVVDGRIDYVLGNTAVVFTPLLPLDEDGVYDVQTLPAFDLSGNLQPAGLSYTFGTTDRTAPTVTALVPAGNGTVIENALAQVVADVGASHDVAVVDFYLNDQPSFAARTAPFTLNFQALPSLGAPGAQIKVSALATDTSGNRSVTPAVAFVSVVADQPPALTITAPQNGAAVRNGDRINVSVRALDDLGVKQVGYRAQTGKPQDAATTVIEPTSVDRTETFGFNIPADAIPGSTIAINASALDTKGQSVAAAPVSLTVLDGTPPTVTITGISTGAKVSQGQQTTAVVSAQDAGGIASIVFTIGGAMSGGETRTVSPVQNSVATAFAFTVPAGLHAGDVITLDAIARDAAGNSTAAARVLLPVADLAGPTITLRTTSGSLDLVPGSPVTVLAQVDDETAVATVALNGQGAFTVAEARQISPPSNSSQPSFVINVPESAGVGTVLQLSATAVDVFGNTSAPATLALTVKSVLDVALPPSVLVAAGETTSLSVDLSGPAPAGGVRIDLASANFGIAGVTSSLQFAAGETSKSAIVTGVAGGTVAVSASIGGVLRASTTVTVRGGIVTGTVFSPTFQPVAGADVTILAAGLIYPTTTDATGAYRVEGVSGVSGATALTVKARDPVTQLIGFVNAQFNAPQGYVQANIVLLSAGSLGGTVFTADGVTSAGVGARVDIFESGNLNSPVGSTFTDENGAYEFPLVTLGTYTLEASDVSGNLARSTSVVLAASGQHVDQALVYLGRGTVVGTVRDGSGNLQSNIPLTFNATSLFGAAPTVTANSLADGTFLFENVSVGTFTVQARDTITNLAGTATGSITQHQQQVAVTVTLASWGGIQGTVFRPDGVTPASNARVTLSASSGGFSTNADADGHYAFTFVPLGNYTLNVDDAATRGLARATGTLVTNATVVTVDLTELPQGTVLATVVDANGVAVPGASVHISSSASGLSDGQTAPSGADGSVLFEHVLAGSLSVSANSGGLTGSLQTTLAANQVRSVTVALEATGSIAGTVFLPDGATPASTAKVALCQSCVGTAVNSDGTFRFDGLDLRTRTLYVTDANNRLRAKATVVLSSNGQVATADMTMVGIGSVIGRVLNPNGSSAPNLTVSVKSLTPTFGNSASPKTDAAGFYRADNIIVGTIQVNTGNVSAGTLGEGSGTLAPDGATLTIDILLQNSAVTMPQSRSDANLFPYDVQRGGSLNLGNNNVTFHSTAPYTGGVTLDIVSGGTPTRFAGTTNIGTTEANGREIAVSQSGMAGLNITRKVLVSSTYFARYLELLSNPTVDPITVDVRIESTARLSQIGATSSGDTVLAVDDPLTADRWIEVDSGPTGDAFSFQSSARLAYVFDGAGAPQRVAAPTFDVPATGVGRLRYGWNSVTVPPGQTVAFMHFVSQEAHRASAQAAAERLAQLPPEALESLSAFEISAIANFVVPTDSSSPLAALPALNGTITGHIYEADGVTPVSATDNGSGYHIGRLVYMSNHPLFPRPYSLGSNLAGFFSIAPASVGFGFSVAATVPVYPFTLINIHDDTAIPGPTVVGTFADGTTTTVTDVVYSGAALIRGVVRRHTGAPVSGARISTQFTSGSTTYGGSYANSTANGSYYAGGILPGAVNAFVSIPHPQRVGTVNLGSTTPLTVSAGQVLTQDLIFQPTGTLQGTVRTALGAIKAGVTVDLLIDTVTTTNRLRTTTDSSGFYRFNDVKLGTFTVQTTDPVSLILTKAIATIAQDATSVVDLTYIGTSSVQVTATFSTGAPAVGAPVSIQKTTLGTTFSFVANADANGVVTIPNVPAGAFIVRVQRPGFNTALTQVDVPGVVTAQDVPVAIAAVVVPFGTVQLQVNTANGSPVPSAVVQSDYASTTGSFSSFTADANGALTFPSVAGFRDFRVRASLASNTSDYREVTARITSEGQVLPITIGVGTSGSVSGRIVDKAGAPLSGISVLAYSSSPQVTHSGTTDADGAYSITDVPVGDFRLMVTSGPNGTGGSTLARMAQHGDAMTIDLALTQVRQPVTFSDANGYSYYIDQEGRVGNFRSTDAFYTMFRLAATVSGGSNATFSGDSLMTPQLDGRQLEVKDFGNSGPTRKVISGTSVYITRRVYVPTSGYFVRYLDILENTGVAAASIDLQISGTLSSSTIAASSDGDTTLATTDGWVVTHTPNSIVIPPAGLVLVGPGARTGLSTATTTLSVNRLQPTLAWKNIVVPAGGRAIVMHFGTQEPTVAAAQAAAERLVQLPPEALTGLSAADAEAIVNFAVPVDLSSNQTAFGTISGQVRLGDGVTPAAGAVVTVTGSTTPIFKPSVTVTAGADGQYSISTLAVGVGTVQAKDAVSAATSPVSNFALSQPELPLTQDLVLGGGVLSGIVTVGANAVPPGAAILITGGSPAVNLSPAVSNGTYRISLPTGTYNVRFTMTGRTFTMNNVEVLDGQVTTASYRFPAIATVRVTVKTATGAILPSAKVTLTDVGSTHVVANANSLGVALVPTVLEGPITVTARTFNGSLVAIVTSQVRPEDNGLIVDVLGQAANGGVLGVVTALDGQTGVPFARVRVYDVERNVQIDNDFTASDGSYSFPSVSVIGSQGFLVRVFSPFDTSLTSEQTGSFADGLAQTLNFSLPIGVLRGTVTLDGTEPIPGATVRLYQELAGFVDVQSATANPQGEYAFVGQGPGNFELVATEPSQIQIPEDWAGEPLPPERLLNATVTGTIPASPAVVTANVQMPPFGTVVVEVQDSDGSTLDEVSAGLASGGVVTRAATYYDPDSGGSSSVTFEHVPLGPFTVQGCWIVDVSRCGTAVGTMTSPNQIVHMTVQVRDGVHVYGQAQNADDSARANSRVVLKAGTDGVLEPWTDTYDTDDSGFFDFGYIPSGPFTLVLEDQSDGIPIGVVQATGAPDGDLEVNIRASAGVVGCNPSLTTTDTFRYDVSCVGELRTGGTTDDRLAPAYAPAASLLTVQGVSPTAEPAAQLEVGDRQVAHGPRGVGAVTVTRRAYVPEAGGFARFLETLTNNSSTALTVEVRVDSVLAGPIHTLVEPTATGNTYAVTLATPVLSEDGNLARPMLAHVFAGPSAAVGVANTHFQWLSGPSYYTWTVTIPAGESVSLMHFAVQGEPDNLAATDALAQSLANLSNADALNGLSVEEKAGVVNFNIP